ncbi:MAG: magnesium transporter [Oscillospiraceae bacterium]|nr:magnesium transporter [Oscillospiraceae bacterium]
MIEETKTLLENRQFQQLAAELKEYNAADIAQLLSDAEPEDILRIFRLLPKELAADSFVEMDSDEQEYLISAFTNNELSELLDEMFVDDTVDIIEEMPAGLVKKILKNTDVDTRRVINQILRYPEDSAGSIMTIEYVDLKRDMTVPEAFSRIRQTGVDSETIYTCYVTDAQRKLLGIVTVKDLLLAGEHTIVGDIMETNLIKVSTHDDQEFVAQQFEKYDFAVIPVVDTEDRLVGIVTFDDAMDVIRREDTEDIEKMNAIVPSGDSYFNVSPLRHARNRIVWLLFLMLSATFTGMLITRYEEAFAAVPLLVSFIPMLMDTGGNCGAQSSTLVIRGLALEEIQFKDFFRLWGSELLVALMCGLTLAAVNFIRVMLMYGDLRIGLVTGLTLVGVAMTAKTLGCVMPMLAKKLRLDPALMASPLITTITDCVCILVYFNIATRIFHF